MTAADLIREIATIDRGQLPALLAAIASRLAESESVPQADDVLLDAREAAQMLGLSESYLYHAKGLKFAVRVGARKMFSKRGIQNFIAKQLK